jgi:hypothetical protein
VVIVDADDFVSPCFLEGEDDVGACHVTSESAQTSQKVGKNREVGLTDVTGTTGDQNTLLEREKKSLNEWVAR